MTPYKKCADNPPHRPVLLGPSNARHILWQHAFTAPNATFPISTTAAVPAAHCPYRICSSLLLGRCRVLSGEQTRPTNRTWHVLGPTAAPACRLATCMCGVHSLALSHAGRWQSGSGGPAASAAQAAPPWGPHARQSRGPYALPGHWRWLGGTSFRFLANAVLKSVQSLRE
jgi:hypothetical protein